jgi:DNA-binding transcriptional LysR family regulator
MTDVNFTHFRLYRDIAHEHSISKAAKANGISQSAASQHLQELEKTYGVQLVDRSVRPLTLTEAGELYLSLCTDLMARKADFDVAIERLKGRVGGSVRVASIYSVGLSEMTRLEEEFASRYPDADLRVSYLRPEKVYESVLLDRADIGLVSYPEDTADIDVIPWRQERMVVVTAPDHPMAQRVWLQPSDLSGQEFVDFDEDLPISKAVAEYLHKAGATVETVMRFDNIQMMKEAVAIGSGIAILPVRILRAELEQERLAAIRLDNPPLYRPLGIIHLRKKRFNPAAESFLRLLREDEPASA